MEERAITRLSDDLIGMIAAGEVVENPASAIKEMVENSLDAGARAVTVEIREGGITYIRVADNGHGIRERDVRMAFERHATSKIRKAEDLYALGTLGFRGEALASIAAVAKVTLTTKHDTEDHGTRVIVEGGQMGPITDAAAPRGTTIVVKDLFYNTPVRLKFLKKPVTEAGKVADVISRLILSRPDVSFRLISNGKTVYVSSGNGEIRSAVFSLYGRQSAERMVEVKSGGSVSVNGLVGISDEARSNRTRQTFIINGRTIRSPLLSKALENACAERVTIGHYPTCVLQITMPAHMVDVNVHPNKLEVRFSDDNLMYEKVFDAVSSSFDQELLTYAPQVQAESSDEKEPFHPPVPSILSVIDTSEESGMAEARLQVEKAGSITETLPKEPDPPAEEIRQIPEPLLPKVEEAESTHIPEPPQRSAVDPDYARVITDYFSAEAPKKESVRMEPVQEQLTFPEACVTESSKPVTDEGQQDAAIRDAYRGYSLVGVLFDTYIMLQNNEQVILIDQHAAHERVLYEKLMRSMDQGTGSQMLLTPFVVHVSPQENDRIMQYMESIRDAGYDLETFGDNTWQIRSVPSVLGQPEGRKAFLDLVDRLGELRILSTRQKRRDAILQMACKKAIKGGDRLSQEEIEALLAEILNVDAPATCPHGRPLAVVLTRKELEKRFRRIND